MRNESYGLGRYHGVHPKNYISGSGVLQWGRSHNNKSQNAMSDYCWRAMYSLGNGDSRKVNQEMERGHLTKF